MRCPPASAATVFRNDASSPYMSPASHFAIDVPDSLLRRAQRGEEAAFTQIYRWFERPVFTLALRLLGGREEAQDALQETMLQMHRRLHDFRGEAPFWSWLRQIALNTALMRLRQQRAGLSVEEEPSEEIEDADLLLPPAAADAGRLAEALACLPDLTRSVLWLYHAEGFTHEEIGARLGRTQSFSKSQVARGVRRLRELLSIRIEVHHA